MADTPPNAYPAVDGHTYTRSKDAAIKWAIRLGAVTFGTGGGVTTVTVFLAHKGVIEVMTLAEFFSLWAP